MPKSSAAEPRSAVAKPLPGMVRVHPRVLTILGTYKCTAACENCCFGSNPHLTKRLGLEDILAFISEGAESPDAEIVVFSGGECFLLREDLVVAVAHATDLGLRTRCVTNGYWAKSLDHGRKRLRALREAGLCELNISTGDFHQEWVAQETVINAACLSVELGMEETLVVVELREGREVTAERLLADERLQRLQADRKAHFTLIQSPWMPMEVGDFIPQEEAKLLNRRTVHLRKGCDSVLRTAVLTPDRNYGFCCGLSREQIPELNAPWEAGSIAGLVEEAGTDFMKIWLFVDGPERILAWAAEKDPRIEWENRYAHHCHACLGLFSDPLVREAVRANYRERVDDVLARYAVKLRSEEATGHDFATLA